MINYALFWLDKCQRLIHLDEKNIVFFWFRGDEEDILLGFELWQNIFVKRLIDSFEQKMNDFQIVWNWINDIFI